MSVNDSTQHAGFCMCMDCQNLKVRLEERKRWEDAIAWHESKGDPATTILCGSIRLAYKEQRKPEE